VVTDGLAQLRVGGAGGAAILQRSRRRRRRRRRFRRRRFLRGTLPSAQPLQHLSRYRSVAWQGRYYSAALRCVRTAAATACFAAESPLQ
jgi:hypothetical protein